MTQYYDPKNEPGGERKLLLAFLLVFIGIAVMQFLVPKPAPPAQPKPGPQQEQPSPALSPQVSTPTPSEKTSKKTSPPPVSSVPAKEAAGLEETVIDNPNYRIVFTNQGAVVKSWILKKYKNDKRQELDVVNPVTARALGYPLSLFTYDQNLQKKLNDAMYVPSAVGEQTAPASITFEYSDGETTARKSFKFDSESYVISVETEVTNDGMAVQTFPQWPGGFGDQTGLSSYGGSRVDWEQDGKVTRKPPQSGWFLTGKSWVVGG